MDKDIDMEEFKKLILEGKISTDFKSSFMEESQNFISICIDFRCDENIKPAMSLLIPKKDPLYQEFMELCKKYVENNF